MQLDVALRVKLHNFYLRAVDGNGDKKKKTDMQDIEWHAKEMDQNSITISDQCAAMFKLGHYHMYEIRRASSALTLHYLIAVGVKKLLVSWDEGTEEQKEYFQFFAPAGACPLTAELLED